MAGLAYRFAGGVQDVWRIETERGDIGVGGDRGDCGDPRNTERASKNFSREMPCIFWCARK
jgi:hypothetical protein